MIDGGFVRDLMDDVIWLFNALLNPLVLLSVVFLGEEGVDWWGWSWSWHSCTGSSHSHKAPARPYVADRLILLVRATLLQSRVLSLKKSNIPWCLVTLVTSWQPTPAVVGCLIPLVTFSQPTLPGHWSLPDIQLLQKLAVLFFWSLPDSPILHELAVWLHWSLPGIHQPVWLL